MAKKCKCPPEGAPLWVMTYGDMMSLLLVFFIMIVALSEIKKEDEFKAVVEEVKKSFGMKGGGGKLPTRDDPELSFIETAEVVQTQRMKEENRANTTDPGMDGRHSTVTTIREGLVFTIGGRITFEPGSAALTDRGKLQLRQIVEREQIRGTNNIIELRGHSDPMELATVESEHKDLWSLSFARSQSVMEYLSSDEVGLKANRFRLIANADREPLAKRAYTPAQQTPNRRVEMLWTESLVQEFAKPESKTGR